MKAELKTTITESVHLDLSITEAHYLLNLLGSARGSVTEAHALTAADGYRMFNDLHGLLGHLSQSFYPKLNIELRRPDSWKAG